MDATCERCGDDYTVRDGCDPTPLCDACAHDVFDRAIFLEGWQAVYLPNCKEPDVPIAIFQYADQAHRWAEENYRGQGFVTRQVPKGGTLRWKPPIV